ncbi:MAG: substrate-binding domain-containing protein [Pirellulales bacterium]
MRMLHRLCTLFVVAVVLTASGCRPASKGESGAEITNPRDFSYPLTAGKYTVVNVFTDDKDHPKAKANAQDALTANPDIKVMVGLWAYNPPMIYEALKSSGKVDEVKIVGFDEDDATLDAIKDGHIVATVVQQPFAFGYKSVELLAAMSRGADVKFPGDKLYTPTKVIRANNVDEFRAEIENIRAGKGTRPPLHFEKQDTSKPVRLAFLTNSPDDFWKLAEYGCKLAAKDFHVTCKFDMPTGLSAGQKQYIEDYITEKYDGLAMSVIDPKGQTEIINRACEKMNVITQDADAPNSNRKFYVGTSNYMAGRQAGKLVKEACPEGGKVAIFVGVLDVLNAQERALGVIHELMDKDIPAEFAEQSQ